MDRCGNSVIIFILPCFHGVCLDCHDAMGTEMCPRCGKPCASVVRCGKQYPPGDLVADAEDTEDAKDGESDNQNDFQAHKTLLDTITKSHAVMVETRTCFHSLVSKREAATREVFATLQAAIDDAKTILLARQAAEASAADKQLACFEDSAEVSMEHANALIALAENEQLDNSQRAAARATLRKCTQMWAAPFSADFGGFKTSQCAQAIRAMSLPLWIANIVGDGAKRTLDAHRDTCITTTDEISLVASVASTKVGLVIASQACSEGNVSRLRSGDVRAWLDFLALCSALTVHDDVEALSMYLRCFVEQCAATPKYEVLPGPAVMNLTRLCAQMTSNESDDVVIACCLVQKFAEAFESGDIVTIISDFLKRSICLANAELAIAAADAIRSLAMYTFEQEGLRLIFTEPSAVCVLLCDVVKAFGGNLAVLRACTVSLARVSTKAQWRFDPARICSFLSVLTEVMAEFCTEAQVVVAALTTMQMCAKKICLELVSQSCGSAAVSAILVSMNRFPDHFAVQYHGCMVLAVLKSHFTAECASIVPQITAAMIHFKFCTVFQICACELLHCYSASGWLVDTSVWIPVGNALVSALCHSKFVPEVCMDASFVFCKMITSSDWGVLVPNPVPESWRETLLHLFWKKHNSVRTCALKALVADETWAPPPAVFVKMIPELSSVCNSPDNSALALEFLGKFAEDVMLVLGAEEGILVKEELGDMLVFGMAAWKGCRETGEKILRFLTLLCTSYSHSATAKRFLKNRDAIPSALRGILVSEPSIGVEITRAQFFVAWANHRSSDCVTNTQDVLQWFSTTARTLSHLGGLEPLKVAAFQFIEAFACRCRLISSRLFMSLCVSLGRLDRMSARAFLSCVATAPFLMDMSVNRMSTYNGQEFWSNMLTSICTDPAVFCGPSPEEVFEPLASLLHNVNKGFFVNLVYTVIKSVLTRCAQHQVDEVEQCGRLLGCASTEMCVFETTNSEMFLELLEASEDHVLNATLQLEIVRGLLRYSADAGGAVSSAIMKHACKILKCHVSNPVVAKACCEALEVFNERATCALHQVAFEHFCDALLKHYPKMLWANKCIAIYNGNML